MYRRLDNSVVSVIIRDDDILLVDKDSELVYEVKDAAEVLWDKIDSIFGESITVDDLLYLIPSEFDIETSEEDIPEIL